MPKTSKDPFWSTTLLSQCNELITKWEFSPASLEGGLGLVKHQHHGEDGNDQAQRPCSDKFGSGTTFVHTTKISIIKTVGKLWDNFAQGAEPVRLFEAEPEF